MHKKLTLFIVVLLCLMIVPLHAQETTFTPVSEIEVEGVAQLSSGRMTFSPDGKLLAVIFGTQPTGSPSDEGFNGVILYDTQSGEPVATLDLEGAISTAFSLDGTMLAVSGNGTVVFDVPKLLEIKTLTQDNVNQAIESGVLRNIITDAQRSFEIGFLPYSNMLYTVENGHFLWDLSQPTDLSDQNNIQSPSSVNLTPPDGAELVLGSFVSSEVGAFAVATLRADDAVEYLVVNIERDGQLARVGLPYVGTEQTILRVGSDGVLMIAIEPSASANEIVLQTLRLRAEDVPEPLFTQVIPQGSAFSIAPNGLYGVVNSIVDGESVAQFYSTESGETVGTLPVFSATDTQVVFSASNRFATVTMGAATGNGTISVYDADGINFGVNLTEVNTIDSLGVGMNLPTLSDPEDCETDSESLTGETTDSACNLTGDALTLDTPLTLTDDISSVTLTYPSVMALNQPSDNEVILGTSETVLAKDFATVPPMDASEAAISITLSGLGDLPLESTEGVTTPRQVMDGFVSFLTNVDVALDGAVIDTFAGENPASAAYFTNANGDVMLIVVQVAPELYTVFIVISAPDEIVLIEPTVYAIAESLVDTTAD